MIRQTKKIRGSGGASGSSPQTPTQAPDSLSSDSVLKIVDLISEGEIVGLVNGGQSIFLDQTVLQNANGTYNFAGFGTTPPKNTWDSRTGTQSQSYMPGFSDVEQEIDVSVQLMFIGNSGLDGSIVRTITDTDVDSIRVKIQIPALIYTDPSSGNVGGSSISVHVDLQPSGGSYSTVASRTVTGKASSSYEFTMTFALTGSGPWNIRVVRDTADSRTTYLENQTYFASYTQITSAKLKYPNSALVAMTLDALNFSSVPTRIFDIKGLKIQIPSNYDPDTRTYTGSWDGTFQTAWSDNPAWVFYDLATSERYGLGAFIPAAQVDKWALYAIGQYCDAIDDNGNYVGVPDGFGGLEPRFTCNLVIPSQSDAYTVIQNLASVFRAMIYWALGTVTLSQDAPQDPAYLYNTANVVDGRFTYQNASTKARHSVAYVTYNDPDNFYQQAVEYVEDQDAIAQFGVISTSIVAYGCTSRGQAHRLGKWLLYTEQHESETVTFKIGLDGIVSRPGQVIAIADPMRAGTRMGGRISSASDAANITVDQDIIGSISGNTLSVLLPDGTIEAQTVVGSSGRTITVQPAFSQVPNSQSVWILQSTQIESQLFRVVTITEDGNGVFTVTAISHDPDKFEFIESGISLPTRSYTKLTSVPDSPQNIQVSEALYESGTDVKSKATVSWDVVDGAVAYIVKYQQGQNNFITIPQTSFPDQEILDTQPDTYTFEVCSVNAVGKISPPTEISKQILGKTAPPSDVTGFSMIPNNGQAYFTWDQATDLDVLVGGQVKIRYTPNTTGQDWNNSIDVIPAVPGTSTNAFAPLLSGTYMIKFIDSSGNVSVDAQEVITTVPYAAALNIVETLTESPTFSGVKTDMIVDGTVSPNALMLYSGTLVDDYPLVDTLISWDLPGGIAPLGTYDFSSTVDLGGVYPSRIISNIEVEAFNIADIWDNRITPMDTWVDIDNVRIDDVNATLFVRTTNDDPSGSPTWSDWKNIIAGEYSARGFQFQLQATSENPTHDLHVKTLQVTLDMLDRTENFGPLISGTGSSYRLNYSYPFYAVPAIGITANNMNTGDYFTITSDDETGFNITFYNSSATIVSRNFYVLAKGYGIKVA